MTNVMVKGGMDMARPKKNVERTDLSVIHATIAMARGNSLLKIGAGCAHGVRLCMLNN